MKQDLRNNNNALLRRIQRKIDLKNSQGKKIISNTFSIQEDNSDFLILKSTKLNLYNKRKWEYQ